MASADAFPGNALRWRLPASLAARAQRLIAHPPAETLRNVKLRWFSEVRGFSSSGPSRCGRPANRLSERSAAFREPKERLIMAEADLDAVIGSLAELYNGTTLTAIDPIDVIKTALRRRPSLLRLARHIAW